MVYISEGGITVDRRCATAREQLKRREARVWKPYCHSDGTTKVSYIEQGYGDARRKLAKNVKNPDTFRCIDIKWNTP